MKEEVGEVIREVDRAFNRNVSSAANKIAVLNTLRQLPELFLKLFKSIGSFLNNLWDQIRQTIQPLLKSITDIVAAIIKAIGPALPKIVSFLSLLGFIAFIIGLVGFFLQGEFKYYLEPIWHQIVGKPQVEASQEGDEEGNTKEEKTIYMINTPSTTTSTIPSLGSMRFGFGQFGTKGTIGNYLNNNEPFATGMSYVNRFSNYVSGKPIITYNRNIDNNTRTDDISIIRNENSYFKVYRPKDIIWKMNESEHTDFQNLPENAKQYYRDKKDTLKKLSWTYCNENKTWDLCTGDNCKIENQDSKEYKEL